MTVVADVNQQAYWRVVMEAVKSAMWSKRIVAEVQSQSDGTKRIATSSRQTMSCRGCISNAQAK